MGRTDESTRLWHWSLAAAAAAAAAVAVALLIFFSSVDGRQGKRAVKGTQGDQDFSEDISFFLNVAKGPATWDRPVNRTEAFAFFPISLSLSLLLLNSFCLYSFLRLRLLLLARFYRHQQQQSRDLALSV